MSDNDIARDRQAKLQEIQCIVTRAEHLGFSAERVATALGVSPSDLAGHPKNDDAP